MTDQNTIMVIAGARWGGEFFLSTHEDISIRRRSIQIVSYY